MILGMEVMPVRMAGHGACYRYCPAGFGTFETYAAEPNTQWIVACHNSPLLGERRIILPQKGVVCLTSNGLILRWLF